MAHEDHLDVLAELGRLELGETRLDVVVFVLDQVQIEILGGELNKFADLFELGARTNVERVNGQLRIVWIGGLEQLQVSNDEASQQVEHYGAVFAAVEAQTYLAEPEFGQLKAVLDYGERFVYELGLLRFQILKKLIHLVHGEVLVGEKHGRSGPLCSKRNFLDLID